jgi:hypothetical protein
MDSKENKEIQHMEDDRTEENRDLSDHEDGLVSNLDNESYGEKERLSDEDIEGNTENNRIVSLVAVEYEDDENYNDEHYIEDLNDREPNATDNSDLVHEEEYSPEYVAAIDKDAIDKLSFHQSESESVNVALKLGDRPRQQVEMSLYSSTAKLDIQLCLLLLPAIFVWRRISLG